MNKYLLIVLLVGFWSCEEKDKYGCLDSQACNYDSDATIDNNSCEYLDCNNECGGTAVVDSCGTCDSDISNDCVQDCAGIWGVDNICGCTDSLATNYDNTAT